MPVKILPVDPSTPMHISSHDLKLTGHMQIEQLSELHKLLIAYRNEYVAINLDNYEHDAYKPVLSKDLAEYILLMINNLLFRPNFIGYYGESKEGLYDSGLDSCIRSLQYYDPIKGSAFNFMTTIIMQGMKTYLKLTNNLKNDPDAPIHLPDDILYADDIPAIIVYQSDYVVEDEIELPEAPITKIKLSKSNYGRAGRRSIPDIYFLGKIQANINKHIKFAEQLGITFDDYLLKIKTTRVLPTCSTLYKLTQEPKKTRPYNKKLKC